MYRLWDIKKVGRSVNCIKCIYNCYILPIVRDTDKILDQLTNFFTTKSRTRNMHTRAAGISSICIFLQYLFLLLLCIRSLQRYFLIKPYEICIADNRSKCPCRHVQQIQRLQCMEMGEHRHNP